ncbi:hypothetical protein BDV06DRAFT_46712 [Aspergillus oleicola]
MAQHPLPDDRDQPRYRPLCIYVDSVPPALCLVDRRWKSFFTPLLYSNVKFIYHFKQTRLMWRLLRTIVARPDLAQHVRQLALFNRSVGLNIGNNRHQFGIDPSVTKLQDYGTIASRKAFLTSLQRLYQDNEGWLETAFQQAGWDRPTGSRPWRSIVAPQKAPSASWHPTLAEEAKHVLLDMFWPCVIELSTREKEPDPLERTDCEEHYLNNYHSRLLALIVAHCPRVYRLNMNTREDDPFLDDILCWASYGASHPDCPKALGFQELEDLY